MLAIARAGAAAGCTEALFTLGDKPELRYKVAREELAALGCETTLEYLGRVAKLVLEETGSAAAPEPGRDERGRSWRCSGRSRPRWGSCSRPSRSGSSAKGGPHWASPDKLPARRLETIELAGELRIPFTSGILIGIGETRAERLEALEALAAVHERHGHLQEVIVQNFRAKPGTRMAAHAEPSLDDHLWTIAAARLLLPDDVAVQAPPNLAYDDFPRLLDAGIDDWGGVSPGHDRPRQPGSAVAGARRASRRRPGRAGSSWRRGCPSTRATSPANGSTRPCCRPRCAPRTRSGSRARTAGIRARPARSRSSSPATRCPSTRRSELGEEELVRLFRARGDERQRVFAAADRLRREVCGDEVSYVVTRNIQYTNVCYFRCGFCAFSKGRLAANLRGAPYLVPHDEIVRRAREAWDRGATEVCLQGGIHPAFTGEYYASVVDAIRTELPDLHIHAFSALEIWQGAETLGLPLEEYLERLRSLGLGSLPGTAAEILDDEVRAVICPDKVSTEQWLVGARRRAPRRPSLERDDHVRPRRAAGALGASSAAGARAAGTVGRVHRVRAAAVRAHGGADVAARAERGRGRRSASRCSCTRSRGSRCTRRSRTSRRRG